jgi:NitT/TauT family transport system substrate-binding protein
LVAVNAKYAEANPDNLRSFFKVADRLNQWVVTNPEEAATELAPLVGVSPEVMKAAFKNSPGLAKGYSLHVDPAGLKNLSDLMVAAGQITAPIDWTKVLDQQYLPDNARTNF